MPRFALMTPTLLAALLAASSAALAQAPAPADDARARYEREREKCMTNNTQDSLATCLREANNALDASRKGQLSNPGPAAGDHASQRCEAFQNATDKEDCLRRLQSAPVSGSVPGGGVLRESSTTTVISR